MYEESVAKRLDRVNQISKTKTRVAIMKKHSQILPAGLRHRELADKKSATFKKLDLKRDAALDGMSKLN